jgi:hypothetical protein
MQTITAHSVYAIHCIYNAEHYNTTIVCECYSLAIRVHIVYIQYLIPYSEYSSSSVHVLV